MLLIEIYPYRIDLFNLGSSVSVIDDDIIEIKQHIFLIFLYYIERNDLLDG